MWKNFPRRNEIQCQKIIIICHLKLILPTPAQPVRNLSAMFRTLPQLSEVFRIFPNLSALFRIMRKFSEQFRMVRNVRKTTV